MLLLGVLKCRRHLGQLLLQGLPSADLPCQLDVERRLAFRRSLFDGLSFRRRALLGAQHRQLGFRELLFECAANGGGLREFRLVPRLTIGEM